MCQLQSSFFAHFMCFEVPALVPPGGTASGDKSEYNDDDPNDDDLGIMDIDDNDSKAGSLALWAFGHMFNLSALYVLKFSQFCFSLAFTQSSNFVGKHTGELAALNESLQDLLDGIQVMGTTYCIFVCSSFEFCCLHAFFCGCIFILSIAEKRLHVQNCFSSYILNVISKLNLLLQD